VNRIKEVIEGKGIKQTWLAERLGKSFNMVNSYVQNRRQPSIKDLQKIAIILGVNVNTLLDFSQKNSIKPNSETIAFEQRVNKEEAVYTSTIKIPLLGSVACGIPLLAEQNIESYISISKELIKSTDNYFILKAIGDSMNEAGINDGDLVLIKQQQIANENDLVVALIDDEATIKEFHRRQNMIILKPKSNNQKHQPIILTNDFRIQGIVETVISI
jgi:repressor LexA